jgi:hypothetical protein
MTLLIAAKAGPGLKPNGTDFTFEPGIVVAADTRLSNANVTIADDGLKVGITGTHGICGMASDSIDIPTGAFHDFDGFMTHYPDVSARDAAVELKRLLTRAHGYVPSHCTRTNLRTTVFFGHCHPSTKSLDLYYLDSVGGFEPLLRDGFNATGSHADWVTETFKRIKNEYPTLTLRPFDGFRGNRVPIIEAVAPLVMTIIQSAIDIAREEEAARGLPQGIGGTFQAAIVTAQGAKVVNPVWYETLKAWQIFEGRLE